METVANEKERNYLWLMIMTNSWYHSVVCHVKTQSMTCLFSAAANNLVSIWDNRQVDYKVEKKIRSHAIVD